MPFYNDRIREAIEERRKQRIRLILCVVAFGTPLLAIFITDIVFPAIVAHQLGGF